MAILGAANSFGAVLGPVMAAVFAFAGPLSAMYVAAGLSVAGAVVAMRHLKEPERHQPASDAADLRPGDRRLRPYMIMWFVFFLIFSATQITTGFFIQDRLGIDDPALTGALAAKPGLSGHAAIAVGDEASAARARNAAAEAGALADVAVTPLDALPFQPESFDSVVIHSVDGLLASFDEEHRVRVAQACHRVLRKGGRVLVIEAPACDRHDDGVTATRGDGKGDRVQFRSIDYWRAFTAANPA